MQNLTLLDLNLYGLFHDLINKNVLLFHSWAYQNKNITNEGVIALSNGLSRLKNLSTLNLNLRRFYILFQNNMLCYSWGWRNTNITNEGLKALGNGLSKLENLISLNLNLYWLFFIKIKKELQFT